MKSNLKPILITLFLQCLATTTVLAQGGLVAYYPFNGNAQDETGNGYNGAVAGASLTDDRFGKALSAYSFDGIDDQIVIGKEPNFPSWDTYAVSLWFLNNGGGDQEQGYGQKILSKAQSYTDFHLSVLNDGSQGRLSWWSAQGGFNAADATNQDYRDNQWHHVVLNKKSPGEGDIWVDGVLQASSNTLQAVFNNEDLVIGFTTHEDEYQQKHWSGNIDDIRIYNRILSEAEILGLFNEIAITTNIGNQSWQDPAFWQAAGLNGIPDSTSIINISGNASGTIILESNAEIRSLIVDSASSLNISFDTNTITINNGELSIPKKGTLDAKQSTLKLKGDAKLNIADTVGNLKIEGGQADTATIILQQDVQVKNELVLSKPVVKVQGDKKIAANGNLTSASEVKGDATISLTGPENSTISAPPGKSQGKLEISKSSNAKVQPATNLQADSITISSGNLQLSEKTIAAPINNNGGIISGNGTVTGNVDAVKKVPPGAPNPKVKPGNSPGLITIEGNLNLDSTELDFELSGTSPGTGYDQVTVMGAITIGNNVTLSLTADSIPAFDFVILNNTGAYPIQGRFEGLLNDGDTVSINGYLFRIYYTGGDGNDVVLSMNDPTPVIGHCPADTTICQLNSIEYAVTTNTIPAPAFTYSFSGATIVAAGTPGTGSGSTLNTGTTNITITATNAYGTASCSFNVEVTNARWYADADGDGFGDIGKRAFLCTKPANYVADSTDCDDHNAAVYPGAPELCDGKDNNCNGLVDDGFMFTNYYRDSDRDGFGILGSRISACTPPPGFVTDSTDCDDNDATTYPGAPELCDGKDNNCNGQIDEGITYYKDADGDGYGNINRPRLSCTQPAGFVNNSSDCNDNNAAIHPGATELCNGKDDNCNGIADDGCPLISVSAQSASVAEGNKGKINLTFTINLNEPARLAAKVSYQTAAGTATPDADYVPKSGTINFAIGQSSKTVVVKIIGDKTAEPDETFALLLSNPVNLTIYQNNATGTIINDDGFAMAQNESSIKLPGKQLANNNPGLVIPNLLRRSQLWQIRGLPAVNRIIVYDMNGRVAFKADNYKNNTAFNTLATGMYFYEIMIKGKDDQSQVYRGKLMILD